MAKPAESTRGAGAGFEQVVFKGEFRPYQAAILRETGEHLADGRIHVVAAPGSGKTVLGLELIRWLGRPALILAPTVVIAQQWGERLADLFLPAGADPAAFVSHDLRRPALITSVTYQALHAALRGLDPGEPADQTDVADLRDGADLLDAADQEEAADPPHVAGSPGAGDRGDPAGPAEETASCKISEPGHRGPEAESPKFDLFAAVHAAGIRTICLDEAHHLRREWHKAVEALLEDLGSAAKVVALTATPPYDASAGEWDRYTRLNGPIDAEIFVPQLVADGTLCPHQDYIWFSTPTAADAVAIAEHKTRVSAFLGEFAAGGLLAEAVALCAGGSDSEYVCEHADALAALIPLTRWAGLDVPRELAATLVPGRGEPKFELAGVEAALAAIAFGEEFFGEFAGRVAALARRHRLLHKKRFQLVNDVELDRQLANSLGKLDAVGRIAAAEHAALGANLRLVVLTDYIRADHLSVVGNPELPLTAMGAVPVFETLRRSLPQSTPIGLLSGSLTLWPADRASELVALAAEQDVEASFEPLRGTGYARLRFVGSNRAKVAVVTEAFRRGAVTALVGTTALLGEGWDSPCVNTLVLASFVGSFMLSNQMRGRAIRSYPEVPDKTANIWHLVALEPTDLGKDRSHREFWASADGGTDAKAAGASELPPLPDDGDPRIRSADYSTLARRFRGFFGPAYSAAEIRTGIGRVDIVRPPFTRAGVERINAGMESRARDRAGMAQAWRRSLGEVGAVGIEDVVSVPDQPVRPPAAVWKDALGLVWLTTAMWFAATLLRDAVGPQLDAASADLAPPVVVLALACLGVIVFGVIGFALGIRRLTRGYSTRRVVGALANAVRDTMCQLGEITSRATHVSVALGEADQSVECALVGGTAREKAAFAAAMIEIMSPIDNPRYVIVRGRRDLAAARPRDAFACPGFVSTADKAAVFAEAVRHRLAAYQVRYTRSAQGRALLVACRQWSYINRNARYVDRYQAALNGLG